VGDLCSTRLPEIAGGPFDFISCHGVLSYIPDISAALRNFAQCLAPRGVVLLGVNGAGHPTVRWRPLLGEFGFDIDEFREGERLREVLRAFDSLTAYPVALADFDAAYLSSDLFGPLIRSLSLAEWNALCRDAGLHLLGTHGSYFAIRRLINAGLHSVLMPRSRGGMAELVDALEPSGFHHIILRREPRAETPWLDARKLLARVPLRTSLHKIRWPRGGARWHHLRKMRLESPSMNTAIDLQVPQWEVEILKASDGTRTLAAILEPVKPRPAARELSEALYLLYQLGAVNFLAS
jgi:SAM-dependent methyltransferase